MRNIHILQLQFPVLQLKQLDKAAHTCKDTCTGAACALPAWLQAGRCSSLAPACVQPVVQACCSDHAQQVQLRAHSLDGGLVRKDLATTPTVADDCHSVAHTGQQARHSRRQASAQAWTARQVFFFDTHGTPPVGASCTFRSIKVTFPPARRRCPAVNAAPPTCMAAQLMSSSCTPYLGPCCMPLWCPVLHPCGWLQSPAQHAHAGP